MKISELISVLNDRKDRWGDMEVNITWEGIFRDIKPDNIYKMNEKLLWDKDKFLLIDADENSYKPKFAEDLTEGEGAPVVGEKEDV